MSYVLTAVLAFAAGLVVMAIFKARATRFLLEQIAEMKARLP